MSEQPLESPASPASHDQSGGTPNRGRLLVGAAVGAGVLAVGGLAAGPLAGALQDDDNEPAAAPSTTASASGQNDGSDTTDGRHGGSQLTDEERAEKRTERLGRVFGDLVSAGTLDEADVAKIGEALEANRPERPEPSEDGERPTREELQLKRAAVLDAAFASLVSDGTLDQAQADAARAALEDAPKLGEGGRRGPGPLAGLVDDGTLTQDEATQLGELFRASRPERPERPEDGERPSQEEREAAVEARQAEMAEALESTLADAVDQGVVSQEQADAVKAAMEEARASGPGRNGVGRRGGFGPGGHGPGAPAAEGETVPTDEGD
ncbi:MAG: hypothetical protein R2754_13520 [Microthrixaceae bacterium]